MTKDQRDYYIEVLSDLHKSGAITEEADQYLAENPEFADRWLRKIMRSGGERG